MKNPVDYDALYGDLIDIAKRLHISFWVRHFKDCHVVYVTHHLESTLVRFTTVEYPHDGGKKIPEWQEWFMDDETADFIAAVDEHRKRIPLQPCDELGWTA